MKHVNNIRMEFGDGLSCTFQEWENLVLNGDLPEGWTYQDAESIDDTISDALKELYGEPTIIESEVQNDNIK